MRNVPPGSHTMSPVRRSFDGRSFRSMSVRSNVMAVTPDVHHYGQASQKPCVRLGSVPAPVTRADAGDAVIAKPAKPTMAAQATLLKVFDAPPR
jgi:hypothetical protein